MKFIPILFILLLFAISATANTPNIIIVPATDPLVTAIGAAQSWKVTSNQTVNISWLLNSSQVQYDAATTSAFYYNQTAAQGYWNLTVNVNSSGGLNSTHINWTVANPPTIQGSNTTGQAGAIDIVNSSRIFNISISQTANISWQVNGAEQQYNTSVGYGKYVNYTNVSGRAGTWTVSAIVNNSNGTAYQNWTWTVTESTISGAVVETNLSSINSTRAAANVNSSLSFYLNDSNDIQYMNITTGDFTFGALELANISTSESFGAVTLAKSGNMIIVKNSTGQGANHTGIWINLTGSIRAPATAGNYQINLATDRNPAGVNVTVSIRNSSRPFYVRANNSNYTISTESWTDTGTTIITSGKGNANLTISVPSFSSSINISRYGYTATNAKMVRIDNSSGYMYIIPDPDVQDPVIVITQSTSLQESNLPSVLAGAGAIATIYIIYRFKKRTR